MEFRLMTLDEADEVIFICEENNIEWQMRNFDMFDNTIEIGMDWRKLP